MSYEHPKNTRLHIRHLSVWISVLIAIASSYLMRMLDVDTEAQFFQQSSFTLDHLVLDIDVTIIKDHRFHWPAKSHYRLGMRQC